MIQKNLFNLFPHELIVLMKSTYKKLTGNITVNDKRLNIFPLILRTKQGCPVSPLLLNTVLEVIASAIRQEKGIKGIQIGKEKNKTVPNYRFVENPKDLEKYL